MYKIRPNFFIGSIRDAKLNHSEFDHVVTVSQRERDFTTKHFPLVDGRPNDVETFESAVDFVRRKLRADEPILLHCHRGQSRSVTVGVTAIAAEENCSFEDVFLPFKNNTHERANPAGVLRWHAKAYLRDDVSHPPKDLYQNIMF